MYDGKTASISAESWIVHQAVLQQEAEVKDQGRNNFVCFNNVGMSNVSTISLISKKLSPFPPQMAPKAKFIFTPRTLISLNDLVMVRLILVSDRATLQKKKKSRVFSTLNCSFYTSGISWEKNCCSLFSDFTALTAKKHSNAA